MSGSIEGREPISWEALAAELAAELTGREGAPDDRPADDWDAVAAELAAALRGPGADPAAVPEPRSGAEPGPEPEAAPGPGPLPVSDPAAAEEEATVEEAPHPDPPAAVAPALPPLSRAPVTSVELEVVDQPDPVVEEPVPGAGPDESADAAAVDPAQLRAGLEALLFVVDSPVDEETLAAALRCPVLQVRQELAGLAEDYEQRRAGVTLRRVGEGWRVYTREEHAAVVERYLLEGQRSRLTQAALETLAVIAYRQPVTRARVSAIRGVAVDAVVRTLVNRGLVYECGSDPDTGGGLYATTSLFLERLGLSSLAELPALAPLVPETSSMLAEHPDD